MFDYNRRSRLHQHVFGLVKLQLEGYDRACNWMRKKNIGNNKTNKKSEKQNTQHKNHGVIEERWDC